MKPPTPSGQVLPSGSPARPFFRYVTGFLLALLLAASVACGGGDGDENGAPSATATSAPADAPASSTGPTGSTGSTGSTAAAQPSGPPGEELDVCTLISQDEVESIVGVPVGPAKFTSIAETLPVPGLGGGDCRFEADDITEIVSVTVLVWSDEDDAESSFDLLEGQYSEVDGLGDQAYRTQPIDEVSVLAGRHELSVGLYFVSEDDDAEFDMARQIAELVLPRLP